MPSPRTGIAVRCFGARALRPALLAAACAALVALPAGGQATIDRQSRLEAVREEIARLDGELRALSSRESGLLGELERLQAEIRLREAESRRVNLQIEEVGEQIERRSRRLAELELAQDERRGYLAFRLREIYKDGPQQSLRRLIGGEEVERYLEVVRYAAYLGERDARVLATYRSDAQRLLGEQRRLTRRRNELQRLRVELGATGRRLGATRGQRERLLEEVREDKTKRERALRELEGTSSELSRLIESFDPGTVTPELDILQFRGLLDWPAEGEVSAGFGTFIHPRFKTKVPHPGLDIEGRNGDDIRSVFDGRVVFASWMRGYGLTAILEHGGGLLSIYAHASALLVEPGEEVLRGQLLGTIGDTGSLRGPFLYFELRRDGRPIDPAEWLRPR